MTPLDKMREAGEAFEKASEAFSEALIDLRQPSKLLAAKEVVLQAHAAWIDAVAEAYLANVALSVEGLK